MNRETRIRRRGRCKRVEDRCGSPHEAPPTSGKRPRKGRVKDPAASSDLSFDEWYFENLIVLDRPVPEVAFFAEQLAMIRSNGDVRIFRDQIEEFLDDPVQIFHGLDLTVA